MSRSVFRYRQVDPIFESYGVPVIQDYVDPEKVFPLKVRVRGKVAQDLQDAKDAFVEVRKNAFQLRDAFGVRSYFSRQFGEVALALHFWQKSSTSRELSRLRWRWKINVGKAVRREVGVIAPFSEVLADAKNNQHRHVWTFLADVADTPLLDTVLRFESARTDINAQMMQHAYHAKGLAQLFQAMLLEERLKNPDDAMHQHMRKIAAHKVQRELPGIRK